MQEERPIPGDNDIKLVNEWDDADFHTQAYIGLNIEEDQLIQN